MRIRGRWRINKMDAWDAEVIDLLGPAYIAFEQDGMGELQFVAVQGELDWRGDGASNRADGGGRPRVEFSWEGDDDGERTSGRGWAALQPDASLRGHIYIHLGDDSGFRAVPERFHPPA